MSANDKNKKFFITGGLFGIIYLTANNLSPDLPDFPMGLLLGLGIVFLTLSLLPKESLEKARNWKWKHRG